MLLHFTHKLCTILPIFQNNAQSILTFALENVKIYDSILKLFIRRNFFMKKLRLILTAVAILALLVTGITLSVSAADVADTTVLTVDGTEYSTAPASIPDGAEVVVYKLNTKIPYNKNAEYTAGIAADFCVYSDTEIVYNVVGDEGVNLKDQIQYPTPTNANKGYTVKLLNDVNFTDSRTNGEFALIGRNWSTGDIYFDLNGYDLECRHSAAGSALFGLADGATRNFRIISSRQGGEIRFFSKVNEEWVPSYLLYTNVNTTPFYLGAATIDGVEIPGDNLTVYCGGLLRENGNNSQKLVINGGTYYNTATANGAYYAIASGALKEGTEFDVKNAKFYSTNGQFIKYYNDVQAPVTFNFDNCFFYSDNNSENVPFGFNPGATVNFANCYFDLAKGVVTTQNYAASFVDCFATDRTSTNEMNYAVTLKAPVAENFTKWASDNAFKHNITLGSDFIYNVYVPNGVTDILVNGLPAEALKYDDVYDVICIPVPAKEFADNWEVTCAFGENKPTLTSSILDYITGALTLYPEDAALVDLLYAVKDYGKAAIEYFGHDSIYTDDYINVLETVTGTAMTTPSDDFMAVISGARLRLAGEIAFVFAVAKDAEGTVTFEYNYGGEPATKTVDVAGLTEIEIGVKAIDLRSDIKVTVNGEELTYNLSNYIYAMANDTELDETAKTALMRLLTYIDNYCYTARVHLICSTDGHTPATPIIENVVAGTATTHGTRDEIVYCSVCGILISRETIITERAPLGDFNVTDNGDGTYTLNSVKDISKSATSLVVPEIVTAIDAGAFAGCSALEEITLPFVGLKTSSSRSDVENLFGSIFGEVSYNGSVAVAQTTYTSKETKTYYIPSSLTKLTITGSTYMTNNYNDGLEFNAIQNVTSIKTVDLSQSDMKIIGDTAFLGCTGLDNVILPDTVTNINAFAFQNAGGTDGMTINIPKGVTVGYRAFQDVILTVNYEGTEAEHKAQFSNQGSEYWTSGNVLAKSITLNYLETGCGSLHTPGTPVYENEVPATATTHGTRDEVVYCTVCGEFVSRETVITERAPLVDFNVTDNGDGTYTLNSVKDISKSATSLVVPEIVTAIDAGAFAGCTALEEITLPFVGASAAATYYNGNPAFSYIFDTVPSTLVKVTLTGGNSGKINRAAFSSCTTLKTVDLSQTEITEIEHGAFQSCSGLDNVILPSTVATIGADVFDNSGGTDGMTINIPKSVTSIGYRPFKNVLVKVTCESTEAEIVAQFGSTSTFEAFMVQANAGSTITYAQ